MGESTVVSAHVFSVSAIGNELRQSWEKSFSARNVPQITLTGRVSSEVELFKFWCWVFSFASYFAKRVLNYLTICNALLNERSTSCNARIARRLKIWIWETVYKMFPPLPCLWIVHCLTRMRQVCGRTCKRLPVKADSRNKNAEKGDGLSGVRMDSPQRNRRNKKWWWMLGTSYRTAQRWNNIPSNSCVDIMNLFVLHCGTCLTLFVQSIQTAKFLNWNICYARCSRWTRRTNTICRVVGDREEK